MAENVDLEDSAAPPSVGRVIAALGEVDSLKWKSQADRLKMCEIALDAAEGVGRPELLLVTRFWKGNVLRAMVRFIDARKELKWQEIENPWVRALHNRFLGILEQAGSNHSEALARLESAAGIYRVLDLHFAGLVVEQLGTVHFERHDYSTAICLYRQAQPLFDVRRDTGPTPAEVPINLAAALALAGAAKEAIELLGHCRYDRAKFQSIAAVEVFTFGCILLLTGNVQDAVRVLEEAQRRFEQLGQMRYAALTAIHSVEAHFSLGVRDRGTEALMVAGRLLEDIGCPHDTLEALVKLQALLEEGASAREVAVSVRRLANRNGGWLPPDGHLPA